MVLINARKMEHIQRNRINLKICDSVYPYVFVVEFCRICQNLQFFPLNT